MSDFRQTDLNEKKLNRIKVAILEAEQKNQKTREKTEGDMVDAIRKIVLEEVKKTY